MILREFSGGKLAQNTIVDPTVIGNIGRYLNHSCSPNLTMMAVRSNTMVPHLALVTNRDVVKGEELCFNYGASTTGGQGSSDYGGRTKCLCGMSNCSGYLPYNPELK